MRSVAHGQEASPKSHIKHVCGNCYVHVCTVQAKSSSQNGEENRSFGVLTITNATSIDSYFATKLAKLQRKADRDKSSSKAASEMTDDRCSTSDKEHKRTVQQLSSQTSSEAVLATDSDTVMLKQHKKKRQKTELEGNYSCTDNKHLCSKSFDFNSKSKKKKKKRHDNSSVEVPAESNSDVQKKKIVETTKKSKKRKTLTPTVADELNQSDLTKTLSKKRKKRD